MFFLATPEGFKNFLQGRCTEQFPGNTLDSHPRLRGIVIPHSERHSIRYIRMKFLHIGAHVRLHGLSALSRGIGIRFKGAQRHDVEEYSRSEGWIRVALGKKVDRHGQPLTLKLSGEVEALFERPAEGAETDASDT